MNLRKGVYDELITASLRAELQRLPAHLKSQTAPLSDTDALEYFARAVSERVRKHLRTHLTLGDDFPSLDETNRILSLLEEVDPLESEVLQAIVETVATHIPKPVIPLSQSALVTNDQGLNYHAVLRSELNSADQVDLVCPFIGNQGLNLIWDILSSFGERLRIITTTYLGATNQRALERLAKSGAQIKVVYESSDQKTSLHAKAWLFHRDSGFTTGTVGSSNLSPKALVDGLEWNIRLSVKDSPELLVTFDRLWENKQYELFDPERDSDKLKRALRAQRSDSTDPSFFVDVRPYPHQEEALAELAYARLEGKTENLIVAATGTGKTLLAAFDYQRLATSLGGRPKLLFVAHRGDILKQSIKAFQAVMRDTDFGELHVGSERAGAWKHVFASIQSLHDAKLSELDPQQFDVVIVDEFHHAEAPTYLALLKHFKPKQLLALTATPERTDGKNVIERFGVPTYELRLWHALDRNLLCPFHYYGVNDDTDLSKVDWAGGRYSDAGLDQEYVDRGEDRARLVLRELLEKVEDIERMRVVAFCATIRHADFMARFFRDNGLNAQPLHSGVSALERDDRLRQFRKGELPILCTVDLFNEGIDVPEINTVLFLRPTESATVFIQQLGRGLRNFHDKGALTVLDFVGQQNQKFRMDLRFRAMTGFSRSDLEKSVKSGFPKLPPGCHIRLDRVTEERILKNLREAIPTGTKSLVEELRRMDAAGIPITLRSFLSETGLSVSDLYRKDRSLSILKKEAGLLPEAHTSSRRIASMIHIDDAYRIEQYWQILDGSSSARVCERMLAYTFTSSTSLVGMNEDVRDEMLELLSALELPGSHRPRIAQDLPFSLHCHYSRNELAGPFYDNPEAMRQGTFYAKELGVDIHLVTLQKSERDFSPTTRYADYFVAPDRLHWESQSTTSIQSPAGQRLIQGIGRHLFFVRETKDSDGRATPFMCIGFAKPISSVGEKPIRITWQLEHPVPDHVYVRFRAAAG